MSTDPRLERALQSLEGLSVGDGFGECFFTSPSVIARRVRDRHAPPPPWIVTDDSIMAIALVRCLARHGRIEQDDLARRFVFEFIRDPGRGYGGMARQILTQIQHGVDWRLASKAAFDGTGSCGNGSAMRVTPLGAYFADDTQAVVREATLSAVVTHSHPEGIAGAIATALAAAWACQPENRDRPVDQMFTFVLAHTPAGEVRNGVAHAADLPPAVGEYVAAERLGCGQKVTAQDTVPFCIWNAARCLDDYPAALWSTVSVGGDVDTTAAIVGGIVAARTGRAGIPAGWIEARESGLFDDLLPGPRTDECPRTALTEL